MPDQDSVSGKRLVFGPDFETILECYEHNDRSERILDEAGRLVAAAPKLLPRLLNGLEERESASNCAATRGLLLALFVTNLFEMRLHL